MLLFAAVLEVVFAVATAVVFAVATAVVFASLCLKQPIFSVFVMQLAKRLFFYFC